MRIVSLIMVFCVLATTALLAQPQLSNESLSQSANNELVYDFSADTDTDATVYLSFAPKLLQNTMS